MSLKFDLEGSIDNKSTLVQVMVWQETGAKPLPEPMLTQTTDAYIVFPGLIGLKKMTEWRVE